jgi:hypothetical protein
MSLRSLFALLAAMLILGASGYAWVSPGDRNTATFHAVFVDGAGKPVRGVEFQCRCQRGPEFRATSDTDGKVVATIEWPTSRANTACDLTARCLGYAIWRKHLQTIRVNDEVYLGTVNLTPGGALSGLVIDHEGKPLAKASVLVFDALWTQRPAVFDKRFISDSSQSADRAETAEDGTFRVLGVLPGKYWVTAKHRSSR